MSNTIIKNRAGEVVDITDSAQLAALFLELVPDPMTRAVLFGTPLGVSDDRLIESLSKGNLLGEAGVIGVMRNTVTLAFVVVLCRWKQLYDDSELEREEHKEYFKNARFSKLFLSAMGKEDITLDLQIFALMELWICLKKADDVIRGRFANIYSMSEASMDIGLTLQKVREALKSASYKTLESGKFTLEYCNSLCYKLLRMFTFLRALKINVPSDVTKLAKHDLSIKYALNFEEDVVLYPNDFYENELFILTEDQLVVKSGKKLLVESDIPRLYLLVETSAFTGKLQHTYRSFDGERETRVEVEEKQHNEGVSEDFQNNKDMIKDVKEMRKFLSFNYKNIRDFAIILSDALKNSPNKKKKIFDICKSKYPKIIPDTIKSYESPELYWDNIVTLILVEMGPSDFLEQIVDEDIIFKTIMENIEWRCIGYDDAVSLKKDYYENLSELEKWCGQNSSVFGVQCVALKTKTILKAMGFGIDENRGVHPFEESLSFKFNNILSCIETLKQYYRNLRGIDVEKCDKDRERLKDIFKNIFAFLQVFYSGLDSYAMTKQVVSAKKSTEETPVGDDDQRQGTMYGRRNEGRKKCFDAFAQAAAQKYSEIKDQGLSEVFEGFCKLCEKYNKSAKNSFNISEEAKRLKYLITRNYICDVEKLRYYTDITLANGTKSTIFNMLENFSDTYYRDASYKYWLDYFIDVFLFLIYNEDYSERGLYHEAAQLEDKDCDPIYPYLVTYYRENVDRDNLKKCTYRVPVPTGGTETDPKDQGFIITLLTEEEYNPSTYFCIPLRYGSSESWWINPFLIPKGFVRRMYDYMEHKNLYKKDN